MNRSLLCASLLLVCVFIGCKKQDAAVDESEKHAIAKPAPKPAAEAITASATPTARPSATPWRPPFGTNTAYAPRDPNSVFMKPAADFLAALKSRGYVLTPAELPEPNPEATGYAVQGTPVVLAIAERDGKLHVVGLKVQAADLKQAESSAAQLLIFVTETVAVVSRDEAEAQRLRLITEHEARVQQSGHSLGARFNPVMLHYRPFANDTLALSFARGGMLSEQQELRRPPNPNASSTLQPGVVSTTPKAAPTSTSSATQAEPKKPLGLPVSRAAFKAALEADGFKLSLQRTDDSVPPREFVYLDDANGLLISAEVEGLLRWVIVQPRTKGTTDEDKRLTQAATKLAALLLELSPNKVDEEFAAAKAKLSDASATRPSSRSYDVAGSRGYLRIANGQNGFTYSFRPEPLQPVKP